MDFLRKYYLDVITKEYVKFDGRVARKPFWVYVVINMIIGTVLGWIPFVGIILGLGLMLPSLGMSVRRLHDIGKSAWYLLFFLIPLAGPIILIVFYAQKGQAMDNQFGPDTTAEDEEPLGI